ncbi:hypothetical protein GNE08_15205 [Trichormus variabilis ARAD]|uniref:Transposase n=1 Tax=Trichormus variabilis N2B TaxID=2681315 RepID=A0ABR6SBK4_ANAVA|nr:MULTISPECIES: hypothetical protein [Nostocaceae]MBC1215567.1 hypothetical protein [Trichormus variabilis ARAD]MBC1255103.1 hypothetical protein [Trichormus variabilis V5]MBC1267592.1 hypothetical protein [Trichormus variabilis FSR]MBC1303566.1 hypothetical protein [Trichormus variabilis N2B]MBC1313150.1 hypothetical protein [Trichormus variabilis PNB]
MRHGVIRYALVWAIAYMRKFLTQQSTKPQPEISASKLSPAVPICIKFTR